MERSYSAAVVAVLVLASAAVAAGATGQPGRRAEDRRPTFIAAIQGVYGAAPDVKVRALGDEEFRQAQVGQQLLEGTSVWTEPGSTCRLHVSGLAILNLAPGSLVTFVRSKENYPILCRVHLEEGTVWTTVQPGQPFTVETVNGSGRARGTQFRTSFDATTRDSEWELLEGRLDLFRLPSNVKETLVQGQRMTIGPGGVPRGATPIQRTSVAQARGLFSSTLGGAPPPVSTNVATETSPLGTQVVYMTRPPGGYPPPFKLPSGALGVATVKPPTFGTVVRPPIVPIKGRPFAGRDGGLRPDVRGTPLTGIRHDDLTGGGERPGRGFDESSPLIGIAGQDEDGSATAPVDRGFPRGARDRRGRSRIDSSRGGGRSLFDRGRSSRGGGFGSVQGFPLRSSPGSFGGRRAGGGFRR